jgi:hypothetical protein
MPPLSILQFCTLIFQHKALADSYIHYLIHAVNNYTSNNLAVVLRLPHQPGLSVIQLQLPTQHSKELFWHYWSPLAVSFGTLPLPDTVNNGRRVDFMVKPTLLFLYRTLELFLQEVGPSKAMVSKPPNVSNCAYLLHPQDGNMFCSVIMDVLGQKFVHKHESLSHRKVAIQLRENILGRFCEQVMIFGLLL